MKYKIPFIKPVFPSSQDISRDYEAIVKSNWFTNFGPYEVELSQKVADYVGNNSYATTVSNCTVGLEIAISHLFDKSKKLVIMPSFTFVAGAEALIKNGYTPLFIDIDKNTWQPNIDYAKEIIQKKRDNIAGILLCNVFGVGNVDVGEWELLANEYNLSLIIDSAAGFGSVYSGDEKLGARGDCEVFSLHATKPFSVGEGGLITSRNSKLIKKLRSLQNFGFDSDRVVHDIGTNAKMQELNCAIGIRQLTVLSDRLKKRQKLFMYYANRLTAIGFTLQQNADKSTVAFISALAPVDFNIDQAYIHLHENGVEARRYYTPALHQQFAISRLSVYDSHALQVTEDICKRILSLPLIESMSKSDIDFIVDLLEAGRETK